MDKFSVVLREADSAGNVTEGPVEIDHVRNSYIRSDGPLTAVIGVEEVVGVECDVDPTRLGA